MFLHQIMNEICKKKMFNSKKKNPPIPLPPEKKFIFILVKYQLRSYTIKDMAMQSSLQLKIFLEDIWGLIGKEI